MVWGSISARSIGDHDDDDMCEGTTEVKVYCGIEESFYPFLFCTFILQLSASYLQAAHFLIITHVIPFHSNFGLKSPHCFSL